MDDAEDASVTQPLLHRSGSTTYRVECCRDVYSEGVNTLIPGLLQGKGLNSSTLYYTLKIVTVY
jgi:hypothetical protein